MLSQLTHGSINSSIVIIISFFSSKREKCCDSIIDNECTGNAKWAKTNNLYTSLKHLHLRLISTEDLASNSSLIERLYKSIFSSVLTRFLIS